MNQQCKHIINQLPHSLENTFHSQLMSSWY